MSALAALSTLFTIIAHATTKPEPPRPDCVTSCTGLPNGDYQSCNGCDVYATCVWGDLEDNRPCSEGTVWDDNKRNCVWVSETCEDDATEAPYDTTDIFDIYTTEAGTTIDAGDCVSSCQGVSDGDYQSCNGCSVYATCSNGDLYDNRPCAPGGLVWDDIKKKCEYTSKTCEDEPDTTESPADTTEPEATVMETPEPPTPPQPSTEAETTEFPEPPMTSDAETTEEPTQCVESMTENGCAGMVDGRYQSCYGCRVYVKCVNGITYDWTKCPWNAAGTNRLQWDDDKKECVEESNTCDAKDTTTLGPQTTTKPTKCVESMKENGCAGMEDGDYQSCYGCRVYVQCINGITNDWNKCPWNAAGTNRLQWDDDKKECVEISETCDAKETTTLGPEEPGTTEALPDTTTEEPTTTKPPPRPECVTSCFDDKGNQLRNGDYQSCNGCSVYATCSNGDLYDNRPCAPGGLVWDDTTKTCEKTSKTCEDEPDTTESPPDTTEAYDTTEKPYDTTEFDIYTTEPEPTRPQCVESMKENGCAGMEDGNYQSCYGCRVYVRCINGITYDWTKCPWNAAGTNRLQWDDDKQECVEESNTCDAKDTTTLGPQTTTKPTQCVESMKENGCAGMEDGDYQSCYGCRVYVRCINGITYDWTKCPWNAAGTNRLQWDDDKKECVEESETCDAKETTTLGPQTTTKSISSTEEPTTSKPPPRPECITSCYDDKGNKLRNGNYQSCQGCNVYASCVDGDIIDKRACPPANNAAGQLYWDDSKKVCTYESKTCEDEPDATESPPDTTAKPYDTTEFDIYTTEPEPTRPQCVESMKENGCAGMEDGNYQSCYGCRVYVRCINGITYDWTKCPWNAAGTNRLQWDDDKQACVEESNTCDAKDTTTLGPQTTIARPECVESLSENGCAGMVDGNYQSCYGCRVYVQCINGITYDWTKCPWNAAGTNRLQWDDDKKECVEVSETCDAKETTTLGPQEPGTTEIQMGSTYASDPDTTAADAPEEGTCVSSCQDDKGNNLPDGNYQSCQGCKYYASCVDGGLYNKRLCPADLVWDDQKKVCAYESETCTDDSESGNLLANNKLSNKNKLDTTNGAMGVYGSSQSFLFVFVIIAYLLL